MAPNAFAAYQRAFKDSGLPPFRIVQTASGALNGGRSVKASAGTHDVDFRLPSGEGVSGAVDLSVWKVRGVRRWDEARIRWALFNLADEGFAGWYRHRGSFARNLHIHAIYVGMHLKESLRLQVRDFLNDRTGLVGHARETFWTCPSSVDARIKALFLKHNPVCAKWFN